MNVHVIVSEPSMISSRINSQDNKISHSEDNGQTVRISHTFAPNWGSFLSPYSKISKFEAKVCSLILMEVSSMVPR